MCLPSQVGSIFEIANQNAIFGVLPPSNPLWLPILGFFAVTGFPTAGMPAIQIRVCAPHMCTGLDARMHPEVHCAVADRICMQATSSISVSMQPMQQLTGKTRLTASEQEFMI